LNPIIQGLEITVLGLLVTFTALGIFILVMLVLKRIFREKPETGDAQEIVEAAPIVDLSTSEVEDDSEVIAVIAAAIAYIKSKTFSTLGASLESGKSTWWVSNSLKAKQGTGVNMKRSG
jgi:sodium pump decarboxylase gamma subunit